MQNSIGFENGQWSLWILDRHRSLDLDQLSDFYAAYRQLIRHWHGLDICANFYREGKYIKCVFSINTALINTDEYLHKFQHTFSSWGLGFKALAQSIAFDIENANKHSEENKPEIRKRIFQERTMFLKEIIILKNAQENERRRLHAQNKAAKKAAKAARVAKALKKTAKQDFNLNN